jgi:hypothetical protein
MENTFDFSVLNHEDKQTAIKALSHGCLCVLPYSFEDKNIVLIGEDHFEMNNLLSENPFIKNKIVDLILSFGGEVLIENGKRSDDDIWDDFLDENRDLVYGLTEDLIVQESITFELSGKDNVFDMDNRCNFTEDMQNISIMCNTILNEFGMFGDNEETNKYIRCSILNKVDVYIFRKLIVYLIKHKAEYTTNAKSSKLYEDILMNIKHTYKKFINYVDDYMINKYDSPDIELVEKIFYELPGSVFDLNIVNRIITSDVKTFVIYTGRAHSFGIKDMLEKLI